ncbi:hypothetical protein [Flavobacterium sp. N2270]|uniref:hypothetical protein n=1 Tax=Flavobacterium sp. N2270 TaxID=2986831 RepID=UPI002225023F|nr:hypothetical protein [Flavobacterium sp. N2270]
MKSFFFLLILFINQLSFSQDKVADSCDLKNKNIEWKTSFENEKTIELKLKMIREKIISDSIYTEFKPKIITSHSSSLYSETVDRNGNNCGVKILFALNYTKNKSVILDLNKNPEYIFILEKLNEINVNKIYPIFDKGAEALYGIYGKSGVVILTSKNRKFAKEIKKFIRNIEHKKPNG